MKNDNNEIIERVSNELIIGDLTKEYGEIVLDSFLKEGILKDTPIINTVVAFYNTANSFLSRYHAKKSFHQYYFHKCNFTTYKNKSFFIYHTYK